MSQAPCFNFPFSDFKPDLQKCLRLTALNAAARVRGLSCKTHPGAKPGLFFLPQTVSRWNMFCVQNKLRWSWDKASGPLCCFWNTRWAVGADPWSGGVAVCLEKSVERRILQGPVPCKHQSSHGRNKLTQAGCSLSKDQTSVGHCFFRKNLSLRLVYWQDVKMGWIPKTLPSRQRRCDCARSFWAVPSHPLLSRTCNNSSQQKAFL